MENPGTNYRNLFALDGKVALVTGGSGGIGAEIARALASAGASVMVTDVQDELGSAVVKELVAGGAEAAFAMHDVTSEEQWMSIVPATVQRFGGLDIVVNNAGIEKLGPITDMALADLQKILDVNVSGVFLGCKHAVRAMRPGGIAGEGGSIINLSSIAGLAGITALGAYSASKGGVRLLSKSIAVECAQLSMGIRCNSIHPGLIKTEMGDRFLQAFVDLKLAASTEVSEKAFLAAIPMGAWGTPQDIAAAAVYLASDASRYVTGTEVTVDGGYFAV